jgi:hypothetical protein
MFYKLEPNVLLCCAFDLKYGSLKTFNNFIFQHFFFKLTIDVFVLEQLLGDDSTIVMQQNLEILDVLIFVVSFFDIVCAREKFVFPQILFLTINFKNLNGSIIDFFKMFGLPNYIGQKRLLVHMVSCQ